ncbi:4-cresol dehydrogenase [Pseudoclavibacter endophyticus]|uniref:FAD-binding oxidoreductase n=1 Tax=Pseudoclavibacter endophyticus TaxID=1778590 RepID=UPI00166C23E4|nr:FAD-binding oxidoreductase [Pseudoclavibacter endophyticus]GGA64831.1 4-cresol dehydrogenase [Pseudoclavibacter endophyticus]
MTDTETREYVAPPLAPDVRDALIAVVGADNALVTDDERDQYRDPYWYQEDRTYDSQLVLFPADTEEVQSIVRLANEHRVPLWTSSQGRNNGYGGPSPRVRGSVLVSLRRMNRVLEINRELAYAVVEPGVRWFDLYDELQATGNDDLMLSIPDLGWGSVIGNSLDNGMTYLPLGADYQAPCGMEVVLADGSLLRTGMGAMPGNKAWHLHKKSLGPTLDHFFTQSNYGIVTRMGIWLMRRPEAFAPLYLSVPRDDQLAQAVDILRELKLEGVIRGVPNLQNTITMAHQFPDELGTFVGMEGPASEDDLDALADRTGIGRWGVRTAVWGDRVVVDHYVQRIRDAWSEIEGSRVDLTQVYTSENWNEMTTFIEQVQAGIPSLDLMDVVPENLGHIGFSPVVPLVGAEVRHVADRIKELVTTQAGSNFVCAIFPINDRACFVVSSVSFDRTDREQWAASFETVKRLVVELGAEGYGEYRAHVDFMDLATDQYSFGDHAYRRFTRTIKDAVDPNGILAPGRHGVWPTAYLGGARP